MITPTDLSLTTSDISSKGSDVVVAADDSSVSKLGKMTDSQKRTLHLIIHILKISPYSNRQLVLANLTPLPGVQTVSAKALVLNDYNDTEPESLVDQVDNLTFERLMLDELSITKSQETITVSSVPVLDANADRGVTEKRPLHYLYQCFHRSQLALKSPVLHPDSLPVIAKLESCVVNQAFLHLSLNNENEDNCLISLIDAYASKSNHAEILSQFLESVAQRLLSESDRSTISAIFQKQLFTALGQRITNLSIIDVNLFPMLQIIQMLTSTASLAQVFLLVNSPWKTTADFFTRSPTSVPLLNDVLVTPMARLLSISCLPRINRPALEFFADSTRNVDSHQMMENNIGAAIRR